MIAISDRTSLTPPVPTTVDQARQRCNDALDTDAMQSIARALALEGATPETALKFIESVGENPSTHRPLHEWKRALAERGASTMGAEVERWVLFSRPLPACHRFRLCLSVTTSNA